MQQIPPKLSKDYYRTVLIVCVYQKYRRFSNVSSSPRKSYAKTEAKKIRFYVLHRYAEYIKNYDKILEKRFPSATQVFRIFMVGVKDFYNDVKEYMKIIRILNTSGKGFTSLTRKEIELYHQMPKDMMKVGPVLLISALPFANYVIFPLAYLFPRHLLTSHFWNLQQKSEFTVLWLKDRLMHNRPVFRHLQEPLKTLKCHELYEPWKKILGMLGSGVQPSVEEILECAELFADKPYSIPYLKRSHVVCKLRSCILPLQHFYFQKELLQMHDMRVGIFRRRARLRHRAKILREMDRAVIREGGVHNLPTDALRMACFIRGKY